MQDTMKKFFQIKRNLIISILFLIQYNRILTRLVVYKQAYDISRGGRTMSHHPTPRPTPHLSRILRKVNIQTHN